MQILLSAMKRGMQPAIQKSALKCRYFPPPLEAMVRIIWTIKVLGFARERLFI